MPATPEFAYANSDILVMWGGGGACVSLRRGDVWYADDQFVADRPDLFDQVPTIVHCTDGRNAPTSQPFAAPKRRRTRA